MNTMIIKNDSDKNENWMKTLPGYQDEVVLTKRAGSKKMKLRVSTGGNGNVVVRKGGSGSGHYGHAGRPGEVGGSVPGKGGSITEEELHSMLGNPDLWEEVESDTVHAGIMPTEKIKIQGDGHAIIKRALTYDDSVFSNIDNYSTYNDPWKEEDMYLLSEELGFDVVPVGARAIDKNGLVETRDGSVGHAVSVQQWVDDAKTMYKYSRVQQNAEDVDLERFRQVAWLDVVSGNYDRHGANLLIKEVDNRATPVAIDNGISFDIQRETDSGITLYDQVMNPDGLYGDVLEKTKLGLPGLVTGVRRYSEGKQVSRRQYQTVKNFLADENNPVRKRLVDRYGTQWLRRADMRVESVYKAADMRLFGYSWTD